MTHQVDIESRVARCIGRQSRRYGRPYPPASLGSARPRFCPGPQKQGGHVRLLGGEGKAAAGGEIDQARITPRLDHHRTKASTAQTISRRLEQGSGIARDREDQPPGIKPDLSQPRRMQDAVSFTRFLPQPQDRHAGGRSTQRQHERKAGGTPPIHRLERENLMQPAMSQPPAEPYIDRIVTQREQPIHAAGSMAFQCSDAPLKRSKGPRLAHNVLHLF